MQGILGEIKKGTVERVWFKNEQLYRFFPRKYTTEQMKREILDILRIWKESNSNE
jgi:ParB family chromosome partitioning protein